EALVAQRHGHGPQHAVREAVLRDHGLPVLAAHEALQRAHGADRDHLEVRGLARVQLEARRGLGPGQQRIALLSGREAVDQASTMGRNHRLRAPYRYPRLCSLRRMSAISSLVCADRAPLAGSAFSRARSPTRSRSTKTMKSVGDEKPESSITCWIRS